MKWLFRGTLLVFLFTHCGSSAPPSTDSVDNLIVTPGVSTELDFGTDNPEALQQLAEQLATTFIGTAETRIDWFELNVGAQRTQLTFSEEGINTNFNDARPGAGEGWESLGDGACFAAPCLGELLTNYLLSAQEEQGCFQLRADRGGIGVVVYGRKHHC